MRSARRLVLALAALLLALGGCGGDRAPGAVGTLERDRIELVAEASEPVVERAVAEGAFVERDALILRLESKRYDAQLAQRTGLRNVARSRLAELKRGPRPERIEETRARLRGAEGMLETARSDLERARALVTQGVVSAQDIDQRRARFDEALAARDAARAGLEELLEGTTIEELEQAEAALEQVEAGLVDASIQQARLTVRAPTAGWVDALPYEVGERPAAGGVVAVLLTDGPPYARVYVPAEVRTQVVPGTAAQVHVDGVETPFEGTVRHVSKEASFTPYFALTEHDRGRLVYLAKIDLKGDAAEALPTGLPVEVTFRREPTQPAGAPDERGDR
jgi:HlyD family secretion protein